MGQHRHPTLPSRTASHRINPVFDRLIPDCSPNTGSRTTKHSFPVKNRHERDRFNGLHKVLEQLAYQWVHQEIGRLDSPLFARKNEKLTKNSRKTASITTLLPLLLVFNLPASGAESRPDEPTFELKQPISVGKMQTVRAVLEVKGELKLNPDGSKVTKTPLTASGNLGYEERIADVQSSPWLRRSVRHYTQAEARIKVGNATLVPKLPDDWRTVCVQVVADRSLIYSPVGPLTREQLDLIDIQGNSLLLPSLLPERPVSVGDRWEVDRDKLARLLGLDVIMESNAACSLDDVQDGVATIEISGDVEGAVGGVSSKIELRAKSNYDLNRKLITWFAIAMRENRAIGHAEPGFDVTARLRVAIAPLAESEKLTDARLAGLTLEADPGTELLSFKAEKSGFQLIHDRRWRSMMDRRDLCVFRLVDQGDLIAQCNISELPEAAAGNRMSLEAFQADVQTTLGDSFGQVVEASRSTTEDGKRVLRVLAAGTTSEIPILWIYYHLSNNEGRRAALAFTLEAKLVERFAEADRTLIETFRFTDQPQPEEAQADESEDTAGQSSSGVSRRKTATTSSTGTTKS